MDVIKPKLMIIAGTRPELIKLSRVIVKAGEFFDLKLVHTGQNYDYELNEIFFSDLEIPKPHYFLETAKGSPAATIASVIEKSDEVLAQENPDAVLFYGDTNSCLAAISAKRRKIPIFHLEAGNRCFDQRVPEEINRKIVDHLSDINMVHSENARSHLLKEGLPSNQIIKTGSPIPEIYTHYKKAIDSSEILSKLKIKKEHFFIVSIHREENLDYDKNFKSIIDSLNSLVDFFDFPAVISAHPRTQKKLDAGSYKVNEKIHFLKPMSFTDYNHLQNNAYCAISDSGTITEESVTGGFPAIMIRQTHERPEGMDVGAVIMSGLEPSKIVHSVQSAVKLKKHEAVRDYQNAHFSNQVIKVILSYIEFVNRYTWRKFV